MAQAKKKMDINGKIGLFRKTVSYTIDNETINAIDAMCEASGQSKSFIIRYAVKECFRINYLEMKEMITTLTSTPGDSNND